MEALLADDELYAIRQRSPGSVPKSARAYLYDWARPEAGWLHKYSPNGANEPQRKSSAAQGGHVNRTMRDSVGAI